MCLRPFCRLVGFWFWLSGYSLSRSSRSSWQHSQRQRESRGFTGLGLTMWTWAPWITSSPVVTSPQSQQGKRIREVTPRFPRMGGISLLLSVPPKRFIPVLAAPTAAHFALEGTPPADTFHRSSAFRAKQDSWKQAEPSHAAPPLHSLKNSQETHCNPGDATQSSRCTPLTYDSMLWNNRLCCLPVTGG